MLYLTEGLDPGDFPVKSDGTLVRRSRVKGIDARVKTPLKALKYVRISNG